MLTRKGIFSRLFDSSLLIIVSRSLSGSSVIPKMFRQGEIRPGPPPLVPDNESRWDKLPGPPPLVPDKMTYDEWYRLSRSLQCQICTSPWEPCRPTGVCTRCHRTMYEMCFNARSPGQSLAGKEMGTTESAHVATKAAAEHLLACSSV